MRCTNPLISPSKQAADYYDEQEHAQSLSVRIGI
jgi:hypothetical protein